MPFRTMYSIDFYDLCHMTSLRSLAKETLIYGMSYSLGRLINFYWSQISLPAFFLIIVHTFQFIRKSIFYCFVSWNFRFANGNYFFRFVSDEDSKTKIYPLASQVVFIACILFLAGVYLLLNQ